MVSLLNSFENDTTKEHDKAERAASSKGTRATSLVSMKQAEKERLTKIAEEHGLSPAAFFRLAADESRLVK